MIDFVACPVANEIVIEGREHFQSCAVCRSRLESLETPSLKCDRLTSAEAEAVICNGLDEIHNRIFVHVAGCAVCIADIVSWDSGLSPEDRRNAERIAARVIYGK